MSYGSRRRRADSCPERVRAGRQEPWAPCIPHATEHCELVKACHTREEVQKQSSFCTAMASAAGTLRLAAATDRRQLGICHSPYAWNDGDALHRTRDREGRKLGWGCITHFHRGGRKDVLTASGSGVACRWFHGSRPCCAASFLIMALQSRQSACCMCAWTLHSAGQVHGSRLIENVLTWARN